MSDTPYLAFYYRYYSAYVDEYITLEAAATDMWDLSQAGEIYFKFIMHDGEKVDYHEIWDRLDKEEEEEYEDRVTSRKPRTTYTWHIKQDNELWFLSQSVCEADESDLEEVISKDERLKELYGDALVTVVEVK